MRMGLSTSNGPAGERPRTRALMALVVIAVAVATTGCGSSAPLAKRATITVDHASDLFDADVHVRISGVPARAPVTVEATATDSTGQWRSLATFRADSAGRVDLSTMAPESGSYSGAHSTGLLWSMSPTKPAVSFVYAPVGRLYEVTLRVTVDGSMVASTTLTRLMWQPGVTSRALSLATDGVDGELFNPPHSGAGADKPAVLVIGGSEGGLHTTGAAAFASHGYYALAVAYFGRPGLPQSLSAIPLEYFASALAVLARQPGVDPTRIVVVGASRGSEAAFLLGIHYPNRVRAVVGLVPSSVVNPGLPDVTKSAWTWQGLPVPFVPVSLVGQPRPVNVPDAVIAVEKLTGPLLVVCGEDDQLWPSCGYADAIMDRLRATGTTYVHGEIKEPGAGHLVGVLSPNLPQSGGIWSGPVGRVRVGGDQQADALGRIDAWSRVLDFLLRHVSS
jgi:dienelactone hydrolase